MAFHHREGMLVFLFTYLKIIIVGVSCIYVRTGTRIPQHAWGVHRQHLGIASFLPLGVLGIELRLSDLQAVLASFM